MTDKVASIFPVSVWSLGKLLRTVLVTFLMAIFFPAVFSFWLSFSLRKDIAYLKELFATNRATKGDLENAKDKQKFLIASCAFAFLLGTIILVLSPLTVSGFYMSVGAYFLGVILTPIFYLGGTYDQTQPYGKIGFLPALRYLLLIEIYGIIGGLVGALLQMIV